MKKNITFPVEILVGNYTCQFNVREHATTDGRYTVEYINANEPLTFQLVRTPIGHWVAGNAKIPAWLHDHANEIGKMIALRNTDKNHPFNNSIREVDK